MIQLLTFGIAAEGLYTVYFLDGPDVFSRYVLHLSVVGAVIGISCSLINKFFPFLFILVTSFFLTFAIFSLRLNFYDAFLSISLGYYLVLFFSLWSALAYFFLQVLHSSSDKRKFLLVSAVIVLFSPLFLISTDAKNFKENNYSHSQQTKFPPQADFGSFKFRDKPNIYLLAFDSLIPSDVTKRYLYISDPSFYSLVPDVIREIPRSLTFKVPSLPSLNSVMNLGQMGTSEELSPFFGKSSSLISKIARGNGYRLVIGWPGFIPASSRGPYIDDVISPGDDLGLANSFLCGDKNFGSRRVAVRGLLICLRDFVEGTTFRLTTSNAIIDLAGRDQPQFVFTYIYDPIGHTSQEFNYRSSTHFDRYRTHFMEKSVLARDYIKSIVKSIRVLDPKGIVVIFGDHGAYLSRSIDDLEDPTFFYTDRHRIFMAVANGGHECGSPTGHFSNGEFNTPSRLLLDIFTCLSDGVELGPIVFDEDENILKYVLLQ